MNQTVASPLPISRPVLRRFGAAIGAMLLVVLVSDRAWSDGEAAPWIDDSVEHSEAASLWEGYRDPGIEFLTQPPAPRFWTIDYRVQQMFSSRTSYQFGTAPQLGGPQYAPLSKLDWSLNSTWTGLRAGVQKPDWDIHFEWLTTMGRGVNGGMYDYDWNIDEPRDDPTRLDSLSRSSERWNDGQKIEVEADYRWSERFLGLPVEFWPLIGFRFQRFDITASHGDQIIPATGPFEPPFDGDIITFNQQYYIGYLGARFCVAIPREDKPPTNVAFQADYGFTSGYNVDHHLYYEYFGVHRYTMEKTDGGAMHFAITVSTLLTERISLGLQADHTEINTTGSHRWVMSGNTTPVDERWSNGVSVSSHQTSLTVFLGLRI